MPQRIEVTIYDPTTNEALLHIDWTSRSMDGPNFVRCRLVRYDTEGLLWVGVVLGLPLLADLRNETLSIGGERYQANLRQLEQFIQ